MQLELNPKELSTLHFAIEHIIKDSELVERIYGDQEEETIDMVAAKLRKLYMESKGKI
jgi:hypothetical protein